MKGAVGAHLEPFEILQRFDGLGADQAVLRQTAVEERAQVRRLVFSPNLGDLCIAFTVQLRRLGGILEQHRQGAVQARDREPAEEITHREITDIDSTRPHQFDHFAGAAKRAAVKDLDVDGAVGARGNLVDNKLVNP